jgi:hypothetical protein
MIKIVLNLYYRIKNKLRLFILRFSYDHEKIAANQKKLFDQFGLDREKAIILLNELYRKHPRVNDLVSEHHTLFAAISIDTKVKSVLEIGTYKGSCTKLLSVLFPRCS